MKILLILVGINAWCGQQNVVILVQCVYVSYRSVLNCERFTYRQVFVFNIHSNAIEAFCLRHGRCDAQCDATTRIVAHTIDRIPNCMDSNHMSIGLRYAYTFDSALWTCCSLHKYMQVWDCDIFGGNWRMGQTLYIYASWFSYAKLHLCTAPNQILFIRFQPNFIPRFLYIHLTHILFLNSNCFLSMKSSIQAMARNPSQ